MTAVLYVEEDGVERNFSVDCSFLISEVRASYQHQRAAFLRPWAFSSWVVGTKQNRLDVMMCCWQDCVADASVTIRLCE